MVEFDVFWNTYIIFYVYVWSIKIERFMLFIMVCIVYAMFGELWNIIIIIYL